MTPIETDHVCPKCGSAMEIGFLLDNAHVNYFPTIWVKGLPERSFFRTAKIKGKVKRGVESHRCVNCGYLESYATGEWKGWPQK